MTLTETIALLGLLGGAVFVTFQISWAIFKEIHNNKKMTAPAYQAKRSFLLFDLAKGS